MNGYLMIGGPLDGEVRNHTSAVVKVYAQEELFGNVRTVTYQRCRFIVGESHLEMWIYVVEGMPVEQAFQRLLDNYKPQPVEVEA